MHFYIYVLTVPPPAILKKIFSSFQNIFNINISEIIIILQIYKTSMNWTVILHFQEYGVSTLDK